MKKILKDFLYMSFLSLVFFTMICLVFNAEAYTASKNQKSSKGVIAIDPGHGGYDPGKVSLYGTKEKDINLSISLLLKKLLEDEGYTVIITRETDTHVGNDDSKRNDMISRVQYINDANPDIAISIHQNSYPASHVKGAQVFYYKDSSESEKLAKTLQASLIKNADNSNTRSEKSDTSYYLLRKVECPVVIVECGFLSCPEEEAKLNSSKYQASLAKAITKGIQKYFQ